MGRGSSNRTNRTGRRPTTRRTPAAPSNNQATQVQRRRPQQPAASTNNRSSVPGAERARGATERVTTEPLRSPRMGTSRKRVGAHVVSSDDDRDEDEIIPPSDVEKGGASRATVRPPPRKLLRGRVVNRSTRHQSSSQSPRRDVSGDQMASAQPGPSTSSRPSIAQLRNLRSFAADRAVVKGTQPEPTPAKTVTPVPERTATDGNEDSGSTSSDAIEPERSPPQSLSHRRPSRVNEHRSGNRPTSVPRRSTSAIPGGARIRQGDQVRETSRTE